MAYTETELYARVLAGYIAESLLGTKYEAELKEKGVPMDDLEDLEETARNFNRSYATYRGCKLGMAIGALRTVVQPEEEEAFAHAVQRAMRLLDVGQPKGIDYREY